MQFGCSWDVHVAGLSCRTLDLLYYKQIKGQTVPPLDSAASSQIPYIYPIQMARLIKSIPPKPM